MPVLAALLFTAPAPLLADIVSQKLEDISFTMNLVSSDRAELRKINSDFATTYEVKSTMFKYKDPLMLRAEGKINGQTVQYVIAGERKTYYVPKFRIKSSQDVGKAPGKRQTLLDWGIVTRGMQGKFLSGTFIRKDQDGRYVFDLRYQYAKDTSRFRVWADPKRKVMTKRMWYNQQGQLMATFHYSDFAPVNGIWFPTMMTVTNSEGKLAGTSRLENIKVNSGIADSVFKL